MSIQVYVCPKHGDWEMFVSFKDDVRKTQRCPHSMPQGRKRFPQFCAQVSEYVLKPIATAIVRGGTGGGKDMHLPR